MATEVGEDTLGSLLEAETGVFEVAGDGCERTAGAEESNGEELDFEFSERLEAAKLTEERLDSKVSSWLCALDKGSDAAFSSMLQAVKAKTSAKDKSRETVFFILKTSKTVKSFRRRASFFVTK